MSEISYEDYWSQLSKSSSYHPANRFRYAIIRSAIESTLRKQKIESIADIGCGDGSLLHEIAKIAPGRRMLGVDISKKIIEANSLRDSQVEYLAADMGAPISTDSKLFSLSGEFDLVTSSEVIEHVERDLQFLLNLKSLCKPGGTMIITTQSGPRYRMDTEVLGHLRHYRVEDFEKLLRDAGLSRVALTRTGFPWITLQKKMVDLFFDRVKTGVLDNAEITPFKKTVLNVLSWLYRFSVPGLGPQLIVVLRREQGDLSKA